MKYNLRAIMVRAWKNYRKMQLSFAECLHRAWLSAKAKKANAKRIEQAKAAAGISEETNTWSGWKQHGYEVIQDVYKRQLLSSGRKTAVEIGTAAQARVQVGRRVFWNVKKVQQYIDAISE